eukprot:m.71360 g.71360  ORF g.71360 m.71360 type:complete len:304 (-) comp8704_c0_seq1:1861-2772(-)
MSSPTPATHTPTPFVPTTTASSDTARPPARRRDTSETEDTYTSEADTHHPTVVALYKPKPMESDLTKVRGMLHVARDIRAAVGGTKVMPVGQLDRYTTGLLLWTDDGALTTMLNSGAVKEYRITYTSTHGVGDGDPTASGALTSDEVGALRRGVHLDKEGRYVAFDAVVLRPELSEVLSPICRRQRRCGHGVDMTASAPVDAVRGTSSEIVKTKHYVDVVIRCGIYHVVKRVFQLCTGRSVSALHRLRVNGLTLDAARLYNPGEFTVLTQAQVNLLTTVPSCAAASSSAEPNCQPQPKHTVRL